MRFACGAQACCVRVSTTWRECLNRDAVLVHEDMEASQGDVDALHRYPLSCSELYYRTLLAWLHTHLHLILPVLT